MATSSVAGQAGAGAGAVAAHVVATRPSAVSPEDAVFGLVPARTEAQVRDRQHNKAGNDRQGHERRTSEARQDQAKRVDQRPKSIEPGDR